jgi:hypothetical protein
MVEDDTLNTQLRIDDREQIYQIYKKIDMTKKPWFRFDYPKESELIPLSSFPPNFWNDLCLGKREALDLLRDDFNF